jgi:hypothetical protein
LASDIGSAHFLLCTDGVIESDDATGDSFGGYKLEQVSITVWSLFIARFGALLTGKPKVFRVTLLLFLFSSFSIAQSLRDAPSVTAKRIDRAIVVAQFAAHGADAFFTYQDKHSQNFVERYPMARPFVHNDAIFIAGSAVGLFSELVIERELRKRGHRKIARSLWLVSAVIRGEQPHFLGLDELFPLSHGYFRIAASVAAVRSKPP